MLIIKTKDIRARSLTLRGIPVFRFAAGGLLFLLAGLFVCVRGRDFA